MNSGRLATAWGFVKLAACALVSAEIPRKAAREAVLHPAVRRCEYLARCHGDHVTAADIRRENQEAFCGR